MPGREREREREQVRYENLKEKGVDIIILIKCGTFFFFCDGDVIVKIII